MQVKSRLQDSVLKDSCKKKKTKNNEKKILIEAHTLLKNKKSGTYSATTLKVTFSQVTPLQTQ